MNEETLLKATGLSRSFNGINVVKNIDISVRAGEVLGLLGPNGAGKTTTLKMLTGVLAPDAGEVFICGKSMTQDSTNAKQRIGYLPEDAPLYSELTVNEYLNSCANLRRVPDAECIKAVERARRLCDLNDVGTRLIGNLSKGYKQRIGLAQAIIHKPRVLVLDEPTNGLDPNQIRDVRALVRDLAADSQALIISTHVLSEVQALCDRVVIIHRGQVAHDELFSAQEAFLTIGFAEPPPSGFFDQLPGILHANPVSENNFLVAISDRIIAAEAIVKHCVETNTTMLEMSPGQNQLEQLFFDITCNDHLSIDD